MPTRVESDLDTIQADPADPDLREKLGLEAKSYAEAAEEALTREDEEVDEDLIKESPPRPGPIHLRNASEPRPLGEIMDEIERSPPPGSPLLRHPRGRLENKDSRESYADIAKQSPSPANSKTNGSANGSHSPAPADDATDAKINGNGAAHVNGNGVARGVVDSPTLGTETFDGVGEDQEPRTPTRKGHRRLSSRSSHGGNNKRLRPESAADGSREGDAPTGGLVYENLRNKSGENLASIKPPTAAYQMSLAQREDKLDSKHDNHEDANVGPIQALVSGRRAGAGWSRSAIRWAPLNVPLQRRLQTLVVLMHTVSIVTTLAFFFMICAIPLSWPLVVPYLIYLTFSRASVDGKLAHRSERLRRSKIWSLFGAYFPARLHRSAELTPTRKYIFGYHPHGIISHGAFAAFATEALGFSQLFPGITNTLLTLDANFTIPLYRDYLLRLGLASVSRESCENLLSQGGLNGEGMGRAITIVIGGASESLDAKPHHLKLVLRRRKGFVKLALRTGADLVPILAFGENDLYDQVDGNAHPFVHRAQLLLKRFMGFTVPLFHARGVFNYDVGVMPYRRPVNIVVGKPIPVQRQEKPDPKEVDRLHAVYVRELERIWDDWKDVFAPDRVGELELPE